VDELCTLLTAIGHGVKELTLNICNIVDSVGLCKLFNLTPNIETLQISQLFNEDSTKTLPSINHKFRNLKTIFLEPPLNEDPSTNSTDFIAHLLKDTTTLEKLKLAQNYEIISKQPKLNYLSLGLRYYNFNIENNDDDVQLTHLEIISLSNGIDEEAFKKLENFLKTQNKIENFQFTNNFGRNDYSAIFTHILSLETLRAISINSVEMFDEIPVRNDRVGKLSVDYSSYYKAASLSDCFQLFPMITSLELINFHRASNENYSLINSSRTLEELVIRDSDFFRLAKLEIPNLRKIHIHTYEACNGNIIDNLTKKHPNITELKLNLPTYKTTNLELLEIVLKNLKHLQRFMMDWTINNATFTMSPNPVMNVETEDFIKSIQNDNAKICEIVRDNRAALECLALNFGPTQQNVDMNICREKRNEIKTEFESFFKRELPGLKVNVLLGYTETPWD
jgi:hypothetical protein